MSKRSGFSLIELVLSLGLFSALLTVYLKLNTWEHARSQSILDEQNLMAYATVLEWTLKRMDGPKVGIWSGSPDPKTHERKFVRGDIKERFCFAEVSENKSAASIYQIVLYGEKPTKTAPIELIIAKK